MKWSWNWLVVLVVLFFGVAAFAAPSVRPCLIEEQAAIGATHVVELEAEDFSATATNIETVALMAVPADVGVELVAAVLDTAFSDASDTNLVSAAVVVGDGNDTDRYLLSTQLCGLGTEVNLAYGTTNGLAYTSADTVDVGVTVTAAKAPASLDAGKWLLYFKLIDAR